MLPNPMNLQGLGPWMLPNPVNFIGFGAQEPKNQPTRPVRGPAGAGRQLLLPGAFFVGPTYPNLPVHVPKSLPSSFVLFVAQKQKMFCLCLAVLKAKINKNNHRIRAGIGPKPAIS